MSDQIKNRIIDYIKQDSQREYTIPDIQKGSGIRNREHVVVALRELELEGLVKSRTKGRVKYYHLTSN